MENTIIAESKRIYLRKINLEDAALMLELLNTPKWLQFIGDRNVKSIADAEAYLENGILKSYKEDGFGFYLVIEKNLNKGIGLCGFVKRPELDFPDIGFAFLPEYIGNGYGYESAKLCLDYGVNNLKLKKICAIINEDNLASIALIK